MAPNLDASELRARLRFDVERVREAAWRLERVDESLRTLRQHLEIRAQRLTRDATGPTKVELGGTSDVNLRYAQALALAALARRATIREILSKDSVSLIAAMAVGRWLGALRTLGEAPRGLRLVETQVEAGRVAYRLLAALRRKEGVVGGMGQLTAAVVVAELVHRSDQAAIAREIEEGLARGMRGSGLDEDGVVRAASTALREAALLLERLARRAEPSVRRLLEEADEVEARVARDLGARASARRK